MLVSTKEDDKILNNSYHRRRKLFQNGGQDRGSGGRGPPAGSRSGAPVVGLGSPPEAEA